MISNLLVAGESGSPKDLQNILIKVNNTGLSVLPVVEMNELVEGNTAVCHFLASGYLTRAVLG